jgi:arylsulfatase A-like enzyme
MEDRTVVFNADHGEMLGDHGLLLKGSYMYDGVTQVPLIMLRVRAAPGGRRGRLAGGGSRYHAHAARTVGVSAPVGVQGRSLVPLAKNPKARHKDAVFCEFPTIRMARTREWKLVHYNRAKYEKLYHLREDPYESTNLYDDLQYAAARADMEGLLAEWYANSSDPKLVPVRSSDET